MNQGAGNHQWIETDWEKLERFDDILICFDYDEPGEKGAAEVIRRLGVERCRRVRLDAKDANEWLQQGADADHFRRAMEQARPLDPDELRNADDYTGEVESLFYPEPGAPADPSLEIDKDVDWFYFRRGEYTCRTGINGHGKSLMLDQILLGLMKQGERVVIFSGEMPPAKHLKRKKSKDESEAPGKMDVAGAGGIVNGADNVFSIWRSSKDANEVHQ